MLLSWLAGAWNGAIWTCGVSANPFINRELHKLPPGFDQHILGPRVVMKPPTWMNSWNWGWTPGTAASSRTTGAVNTIETASEYLGEGLKGWCGCFCWWRMKDERTGRGWYGDDRSELGFFWMLQTPLTPHLFKSEKSKLHGCNHLRIVVWWPWMRMFLKCHSAWGTIGQYTHIHIYVQI